MIALSLFLVVAAVSGLVGLLVYRLRRKRRLIGLAVLGVLLLPVLSLLALVNLMGDLSPPIQTIPGGNVEAPMFELAPLRLGVSLALLGGMILLIIVVFWLRRDQRARSFFSILGTVTLAGLLLVGAATAFFILPHMFPATDDPKLRDRNELKVTFIEPPSAGHFRFVHQDETAVGEDFEIVAEVSTSSSKRPADPHRFEIQAPKSLELRTPNRCARVAAPEDGRYACVSASSSGGFRAKWDATPTATGSARLRLMLPKALLPAIAIGPNWKAVVAINDVPATEQGTLKQPRWAANLPAAELSPTKPTLSLTDYDCSLDLELGEIACATKVLRTLGVSESTYAMLGIVGSVLAGGLGSGWLVQFLAWAWRKIRPEPAPKLGGTSSDW